MGDKCPNLWCATSCCAGKLASIAARTRRKQGLATLAKRSNPKLIGGFVIGAIALLIAGILAFSGGQYFSRKEKGVLFFDGSLAGLDVGSPVTFRGVKVGTVTGIVIQYNVAEQLLHIPV